MGRKKIKLAWISQKAIRCSTFRKRRESLLKKVRQLSALCDVKACAIIYDPDEEKVGKPKTWPSEEETKEILSSFMSMPEMEQRKTMVDREEYLRQNLEKLEEQKKKILSNNMETLLTIFLHKCMVGERSVNDLRTVDEAECLMRVIEQKMKAVKDRIKEIGKGKMVIVDKAEDGREHDRDLKSLCKSEVNAPTADGDYWMINGTNDDLFWSCGNNRDVIQKPCFSVDQMSPYWMDSVMSGVDCNIVNEMGDDFTGDFKSNGNGGLEGMFQQPCFNVGESSSLMGPSSCWFRDDSWLN